MIRQCAYLLTTFHLRGGIDVRYESYLILRARFLSHHCRHHWNILKNRTNNLTSITPGKSREQRAAARRFEALDCVEGFTTSAEGIQQHVLQPYARPNCLTVHGPHPRVKVKHLGTTQLNSYISGRSRGVSGFPQKPAFEIHIL